MVKKHGAAPVTKADLDGILQSLTRLDSKIDGVGSKVDSKIDGLRTELKGDISGLRTELKGDISGLRTELKGDIRLLMIESVDTNARLKAMEDRLTAKMDAGRAEDAGLRESFLGRMETIWRESAAFPKILDEHGELLRGHDRRIAALEAQRPPTAPAAGLSSPQP